MIKVKGREVKKRWIVLFAALAAICGLGLGASPEEGLFEMTNESLWANVAWMITATIFVLMMTPGCHFFMAEWSGRRMSSRRCCRVSSSWEW